MFRFILLSIGLVLVLAEQNDDHKECGRLIHGTMKCCKKEMTKPGPESMKECLPLAKKPPSCDVEICIASKLGIASADGTIDKKALAEHVEKTFIDPDVLDSVMSKCVNGDLSKYGKEDFCDLMKLKMCIGIQGIKSCDDWRDDGECSGMEALAEECNAIYKDQGF